MFTKPRISINRDSLNQSLGVLLLAPVTEQLQKKISLAIDDFFVFVFQNTTYTYISANVDCRLYIYARRYPRETASPPAALVPGPIYNVTVSCELRCRNHTESSDLSCHFLRLYGTNVRFSPLSYFHFWQTSSSKTQHFYVVCVWP